MSKRAAEIEDLTPDALEARGQRLIAEGHRLVVRAVLRRELEAHELIRPEHSPLGRRQHNELARSGKIPAVKEKRTWLILRSDLMEYLRKHGQVRGQKVEEDVDDIIKRMEDG